MNTVTETKKDEITAKRKEVIMQMIDKGIQVPLTKLLDRKQILSLEIIEHVITRYKERFVKLHDFQIEQEIRTVLLQNATIVENGHSGRWLVHAKGFIFVMDDKTVYTTYDAKGKDKSNIVDQTKATLHAVNRKSRGMNRLNQLFEMIKTPAEVQYE